MPHEKGDDAEGDRGCEKGEEERGRAVGVEDAKKKQQRHAEGNGTERRGCDK